VNAFVSGGYLPKKVRGTKSEEIIHIADWYRTLTQGIAGEDPTDHWANESGLPPIDSLNVWPLLSGMSNTSVRESFLVTKDMIIDGAWKYVRGGTTMIEAAWGGPYYPNASTATDPIDAHSFQCPQQGCLFDVVGDPSEKEEVSADHPSIVARMKSALEMEAKTIFNQAHTNSPQCEELARTCYGGFYGPFQEVTCSAFTSSGQVNFL